MQEENPEIGYRFEHFLADPQTGRLLCGDEVVAIEPKVFRILIFLIENRHRLVEKQELLDVVWHDVVVTENALTRAIARLRKILGDEPRTPRYVETVHSRGYRFVAEVRGFDAGTERAESAPSGVSTEVGKDDHVAVTALEGKSWDEAMPAGSPWPSRTSVYWLSAMVGVLLMAAVTWQRYGGGAPVSVPTAVVPQETPGASVGSLDRQRIAALPIVDLSRRSDEAYFVDGLTEQMISTLSRIEGLRVLPRTTVMAYKGTGRRIAEIGRELEVGTVLEGSVRRSDEQLRITVQLVDVALEQTLWSLEFDRPLRDIFAIQSEVAVRVAEALQSSITPAALRRMERGPTQVMTAWDHYLRGRQFHQQRDHAGLSSAVEFYRRALKLDPSFALAQAQLAAAQAFQALTLEEPPGWPEATIAAAERALELDPGVPEAYRALAGVAYYQGQMQRAYELAMRAVELNPNVDAAVYNASSFAQVIGRLDEAVLLLLRTGSLKPSHRGILAINLWELGFEPQARELAQQVLQEEPLTIYLNLHVARRDMLAGRWAEALERLERLAPAYPLWEGIWHVMGRVEMRAGRPKVALEHFEKVLQMAEHPEVEVRRAQIQWQQGEQARAGEVLEKLAVQHRRGIEEGSDSWYLRWQLAAIEAVRGNADAAVRWLKEAVDLGYYNYRFDRSDPMFESLYEDPRFQEQLRRMEATVTTKRERLMRELGPGLGDLRLPPSAVRRPATGTGA